MDESGMSHHANCVVDTVRYEHVARGIVHKGSRISKRRACRRVVVPTVAGIPP